MIKIAITDDHPAIAEGIKSMFSANAKIQVGSIYPDGKTTLQDLPGNPVDILLLDINLPDMDGLEVCKHLTGQLPGLKIIAFTSYRETGLLKSMLNSGAAGFLLKNAGHEDILEAIYDVYNGEDYIQPEMKELLLKESLKRLPDRRFIPRLTRREKEILGLILEELTTQEIAEKLFVSPKTVETHRLNLLQKLGVKNTAGLVKVTLEKGLL